MLLMANEILSKQEWRRAVFALVAAWLFAFQGLVGAFASTGSVTADIDNGLGAWVLCESGPAHDSGQKSPATSHHGHCLLCFAAHHFHDCSAQPWALAPAFAAPRGVVAASHSVAAASLSAQSGFASSWSSRAPPFYA